MVVLGIINSGSCFIAVAVGGMGRDSDSGVFANLNLGEVFLNGFCNLPDPVPLQNAAHLGPMPFIIVSDRVFPL